MMVMTQVISVPFSKLRRIIHLADVHIRLYKRHQEFREVFEQLFQDIKQTDLTETVIVVAGDIVHSKTDLSPEMVDLASYFLSSLANIAPTVVIAGNHDLNQANPNRLDALSPICDNINNAGLHYVKYSGIYKLADCDLAVMSLVGDKSDWPSGSDCRASTRIALFHGPVHDATTDVGYTVTNRHITVETFDNFDITLLGDIHRHQKLQTYDRLNGKPIIVYPGSLVQQNHGELPKGHGWCDWDVENRAYTFHEVQNKVGYYTLKIDELGNIPDYSDMPKNVRLRVFAGGMEETEIKKLLTSIRAKHIILEAAVSNFGGHKKDRSTSVESALLDIHDVNFQNKLIEDYLRNTQPSISADVLEKVAELNKTLNENIGSDEFARKTTWIPKSIKFDNLFTYGESNYINFDNMQGVAGIFAPNASGKTSIADAICFALYDRTPRTTKAASIMNYQRDTCYCEFKFTVDEVEFVVERKGKKNKKGEVKIDVDFYRVEKDGTRTSLNGEERRYTNNNIKHYVGEYDDFVLTTLSSSAQTGLFVDRGQADRKDLLSQFMGLTIFDRLHLAANDESKEIASELKRFKQDDFTQDLVDLQKLIKSDEDALTIDERKLNEVNEALNDCTKQIQELYEKKVPLNIDPKVTLTGLMAQLKDACEKKDRVVCERPAITHSITTMQNDILKLSARLADGGVYEEMHVELLELSKQLEKAHDKFSTYNGAANSLAIHLADLEKHQYDPDCKFCILNGDHTLQSQRLTRAKLEDNSLLAREQQDIINSLTARLPEYAGVPEKVKEIAEEKRAVEKLLRDQAAQELRLAKLDTLLSKLDIEIAKITKDVEYCREAQDAIKKNENIGCCIGLVETTKGEFKREFNQLSANIRSLQTKVAVNKEKRQVMLNRIAQAESLETKYEAYEAYLAAVCRDGLPFKLIAEVLPEVEVATNNLLSQMVEFSLRFDMQDGKNVNMRLAYDEDKMWPLELASGMEKFISGLAIRVALMRVSSLPKSNFLIIDEGLGALDPDNLSSMYGLFDVLRTQFDFIMVISHVDSVRDVSDRLLEIKRNNGFSRIEVE
jgi:DNA repair exonuclease SbcCD ATPase subunit/DNA repair exonuclease SbcCD nuclease subunit